jgi:hypothetical protein
MHPGRETPTHYFSCSGGTGMDFTKSVVGHITPNLCFCIRWDLQVTHCIPVCLGHNKHIGTVLPDYNDQQEHCTLATVTPAPFFWKFLPCQEQP